MKKLLSIFLVILLLLFTGCAQRKTITTTINGKKVTRTYKPYGLFDKEDKNPNIEYRVSIPDIILTVILFETIIVPIVSIGWYLYEPVDLRFKM